MSRARVVATASTLMLVVLASGCMGLQRRGAVEPSPTKTAGYGSDLDLDKDALKIEKKPEASDGDGTLLVQLINTDNAPVPGAILRYRGDAKGSEVTDAKGIATFKLPAGSYTIEVVKCGRTVVIDDTAQASATVVAGGSKRGSLQVDTSSVTQRFQPANLASSSEPAPWTRGDTIQIGVRFEDMCTFDRAPDVVVGTYRWRAGGSLAIVDTPRRTNAKGTATVEITCKASGDARLEVYHPAYPNKVVDVLASLPNPAFGAWCA